MSYDKIQVPAEGGKISMVEYGHLDVPNNPIIPFIEGDGVGPEVTSVARVVLDKAIEETYRKRRNIAWRTLYAGKEASNKNGEFLPADTLEASILISGSLIASVTSSSDEKTFCPSFACLNDIFISSHSFLSPA